MLVMWTGRPPPLTALLDGVVYGVKALFAALGYGTEPRKRCRAVRRQDAVRLLQDRPAVRHVPDQQALARQVAVETLPHPVLQQQILAAVRLEQHLVALFRRVFDGRKDQFLLHRRVDDGRLDPAQLLLAPGAEVQRLAVLAVADRHRAPDAQARLVGALRIEVRQAEHVAELVADHADRRHRRVAALRGR